MQDKRLAIATLRAIAASAEKLALDLERGSLWEGEYGSAVAQIRKNVDDLPSERR